MESQDGWQDIIMLRGEKVMEMFRVFKTALSTGEALLGVTYSDYEDAFSFSNNHYSKLSHHLIDYYENHSNATAGEYEQDLIRYFYIKFIENRIASDLFANTSRGNVCDIFFSPFDVPLKSYPTNLPSHLEALVNEHQEEGGRLATSILNNFREPISGSELETILNAVGFLGQTIGYHLGKENQSYKGFNCSELLTRNELNEIAGVNFCKWLESNGFSIEETNYTRDTVQNIIANIEGRKVFILLAAEIAPKNPGFLPMDLDALYEAASNEGALPYYASVSIASCDKDHFDKQVVLFGDKVQYRVNAFGELEKE